MGLRRQVGVKASQPSPSVAYGLVVGRASYRGVYYGGGASIGHRLRHEYAVKYRASLDSHEERPRE